MGSRQISSPIIDAVLRRPWWKLAFPPALESAFEAETGEARCRHLAVYGLVALLLYDVYLLSDLRVIPDIFASAVVVRLGVVTPFALAMILALRLNPPPVLRESLQAAISVVITASILWLTVASHSATHVHRQVGIILVVLFANVVQRLRFWYAAAASLLSFALYTATVVNLHDLPIDSRTTAIVVLANVVVFTLVGTHALERDARREFLFRLQDRLRRDELERMAHRDSLTELGNRRYLDEALGCLWDEARAEARSIAVLILDIDGFKAFNDRYGHLAGDACLRRVSAVVAAELGDTNDIVARFGGEELVVVRVDRDLAAGGAVAERLRRAVAAIGIPHAASPHGVVTVSIGVAAGIPDPAFPPDSFLAAADAALYAAKHNGRNQVWPPAVPPDRAATRGPAEPRLPKVG